MSDRNGSSSRHTSDDAIRNAIASAFSSSARPQPQPQRQRDTGDPPTPQNTPMSAGTPHGSSPPNDAQFCRDGKVVEYQGDRWMRREDERVVIEFKEGDRLVLRGQQAFDARMEVVEWDKDLQVEVFYAGPGAVKEVKRSNGVMVPIRVR